MLTVLPFEIISRNEKFLLISYLSSIDLHHDGMKEVLNVLHKSHGNFSEEQLTLLFSEQNIVQEDGEEFLISNGIIKKLQIDNNALWESVVILTDNVGLFSQSELEWKRDGIMICGVYNLKSFPPKIKENTLVWIHLETYSSVIIRAVYQRFIHVINVAFVHSYYQKEIFRIDGVYSPQLGTPCHFCHIERWLSREEKSFRRNEMSWANLLILLQTYDLGLPAIAISETERGFSLHLIKRHLQELTGNSLVKVHVDTLMSSVSTDLITCVLNREPVIHWHSCDCTEK